VAGDAAGGRLTLTADELEARRAAGEEVAVIDVRSRREYDSGHVPGALHVPFWRVPFAALPAAASVVLYCGHGPRAAVARAALWLRGGGHGRLLQGHWAGWRRDRRPQERG
jgi:rhodanese-related sulfurtransferase